MIVELVPHVGVSFLTKKLVYHQQWIVKVDGTGVGYLAFRPGSKVCLTDRRFSPIDIEEIERQVLALTKIDPGKTVMAPDVPNELLENSKEEFSDDIDDLDP